MAPPYPSPRFADSMLVIPKQLAVNAAQDATDIVAKLRSNHNAAQSAANTDADLKRSGLDCVSGATLYLPCISPHLDCVSGKIQNNPDPNPAPAPTIPGKIQNT